MSHSPRFSVVPLSEVPTPVSSIKVGSLEAVLIDGTPDAGELPGPSKASTLSYEVQGLPRGQKAWILKEDEIHQVIRQMHGESEWLGEYATTEDALRALASSVPQ